MAATLPRLAMETYGFLVLMTIIGLAQCRTRKGSPELVIQPAGLIKQGDNITITCSVRKPKIFDFVRVVRLIDKVTYTISNGKLVQPAYEDTGRYRMGHFETGNNVDTTAQLLIENIQGRDGGTIGCLLLPQEVGAYEELIVNVPPKSVKLLYLQEDGLEREVPPGGTLQMIHGVETAIMCRIYVDGNDQSPKIEIDFDGKEMTSAFIKDFSADDRADEGGFQVLTYNATYKYLTNKPNKDDNGKQVSCSAVMKHFPPVIAKAKLEILYPPELSCKQRLYAKEGTPDVKIACRGKMHPPPTHSVWTFGNEENKTILESGEQDGGFIALKEALGGDEYELSITIKEVKEEHFRNYKIEVKNGIGEKISLVRLVKEGTNPPANPEEMQIHGGAMRPTLTVANLITLCVFILGALVRGL